MIEQKVPNFGIKTYQSLRHGRRSQLPPINKKAGQAAKTLRESSLLVRGAQLFNSIPKLSSFFETSHCIKPQLQDHGYLGLIKGGPPFLYNIFLQSGIAVHSGNVNNVRMKDHLSLELPNANIQGENIQLKINNKKTEDDGSRPYSTLEIGRIILITLFLALILFGFLFFGYKYFSIRMLQFVPSEERADGIGAGEMVDASREEPLSLVPADGAIISIEEHVLTETSADGSMCAEDTGDASTPQDPTDVSVVEVSVSMGEHALTETSADGSMCAEDTGDASTPQDPTDVSVVEVSVSMGEHALPSEERADGIGAGEMVDASREEPLSLVTADGAIISIEEHVLVSANFNEF
ncbi:Hypothetical predicted protein [Octopus vulgaris]|uniref:Uncharacterized protein n=1 Tax=Octopus vulgaris TaxID=6645 RepID=A0AA36C0H0_OCTVU|nr:Hypothetical predicted protein [Octopus vulgaris]